MNQFGILKEQAELGNTVTTGRHVYAILNWQERFLK